ncbi:exosortase Y-associated Wzy-like protein [Mucilaginibacter sp. HD30]
MDEQNKLGRHFILFLPWMMSLVLEPIPIASYLVAWLGSFFIFYVSLIGKIKPLPNDRTFAEQLMRPIIIVQIIFAGFMACSSIFYFLNVLGYKYLSKEIGLLVFDEDTLVVTAKCQQYYCLGHAAFVSGILIFMKYPVKKKYYVEGDVIANLLLVTALILFPVSLLFLRLPGLSQFYYQCSSLSFIAGTLALAFAIPLKKYTNTLICLGLYFFNFYQALTSGYKEPVIVSVLVLAVFLYPNYKKIVTIVFVPALVMLFLILPTYVNSFRGNVWAEGEEAGAASQAALDAALNDENDDTNWNFLVYRFSEVDMFTKFVKNTPEKIDFYGFQILEQSGIALVPRIFWPSKPSTEELVMQRVYDAGVVNKNSSVSAKPAFIVDAYLSYGATGILVCLFLYGAVAQFIAVKAEELFGGYVLGTALIYSGLFQLLWRGLSFEFLINNVFWSYVSMWIVFKILRSRNILQKV